MGIDNTVSPPTIRYQQLAEDLRQQMRSGQLKPGDRLPSFADMRSQGISQNTMEKVHALLERERLVERRHRAGVFVADRRAQTEARTGIIGVSGFGFTFKGYSPYWVRLLAGIREAADEAEKQILLLDFKSNKGWEKADGVLICDWSSAFTMQWLPPQMPCVSLLVPSDGVVSVYADDYAGGRLATEYLLGLGHRRIAYMHSPDLLVSGRRLAGWRDALQTAGVEVDESWAKQLRGSFDYGDRFVERGREVMRSWLKDSWEETGCTAVIAQNDETALGIIQALTSCGIRVPEDVSVVGFDGAADELVSTCLTTVKVPLHEIGKNAVELLIKQLDYEEVGAPHRVFPLSIVQGETAAPLK